MIRSVALVLTAMLALTACIDRHMAQQALEAIQANGRHPEVRPVILNSTPPFHYPPTLFSRRVQGNVTLRLYVDSTGAVWPESTTVTQSSGYPALDSAAVAGSRRLRFSPAKQRGHPVAVMVLLPILYRHPGSRPLPGDSLLPRKR
ncbi:MAG TPA: energy transducer TonB [Gemmatimonadaceae bacterium]|nr:energy transducer TonB [Gemmatimonadaceae bacterium]